MQSTISLLIITPQAEARRLRRLLQEPVDASFAFSAVAVTAVSELATAQKKMEQRPFSAVFLSVFSAEGLAAVSLLRQQAEHLPVIVIVPANEDTLGSRAVRLGAYTYCLNNQLTAYRLHIALHNALLVQPELRQMVYSRTFDSFPAKVMALDPTGSIVAMNQRWERASAFSDDPLVAHTIIGGNYLALCQALHMAELVQGIQDVLDGRIIKFTHEYAFPSQEPTGWFVLIMMPLLHNGGGAVITRLNITEYRHQYQDALSKIAMMSATTNQFFQITHELRAPLTVIQLYLDLLEKGVESKKEDYMTIIRKQLGRLESFVNEILYLARLDSGRSQTEATAVDLDELITAVVKSHAPRAQAANLLLTYSKWPVLPPVRGVQRQLHQVITNLVTNALRYTIAGSITIRTFVDNQKEQVCLQVSDTGIGISEEDLPYVFDRFFRSEAAREIAVPGTGLGLAIVKTIVTKHQGAIDVESSPGVGSTFSVWLPIYQAPE